MTYNNLVKKAQNIFNNFIKNRDQNIDGTWTCISCGIITDKPNASHYANVNLYKSLRFDENNVHCSCIKCNRFGEGNLIPYRINLINKIGISRYNILEEKVLNYKYVKFTVDELNDIIKKYKI